jgi:tetratricopeptide (TPR) repeat protein
LYAYRALGQAAQTGNDLDAAERWFNQALEVAPNDAQARTELEAVRRAKGAPSPIEATPVPVVETSPAPSATPPATLPTATPGPDAPGSVSAAQFQQTNNQLAASAQQLLQQGDQAWRAGNADEARRLWREAQVKGVATSVYNQAGQRLQHDLNNEDPLGQ